MGVNQKNMSFMSLQFLPIGTICYVWKALLELFASSLANKQLQYVLICKLHISYVYNRPSNEWRL